MYITDAGTAIQVHADSPPETEPRITPATYLLRIDQKIGLYLEKHPEMKMPPKIYGDTERHCERIFTTFNDRPNNTGILLSGEKGSGKTLLSKMIAQRCIENDIPVILISSPFQGDAFKSFLASIEQPYMLLFDEFEKVYNEQDAQNDMLSLLDGVVTQKRLIALTTNDKYAISKYMRNRPGRIFYNLDFNGLSTKFIREFAEDHLEDKSKVESIVRVTEVFSSFNFDMLQALIEDMNRYKEEALDSLEFLNIEPVRQTDYYKVTSIINKEGVEIDTAGICELHMHHPLIGGSQWFEVAIPGEPSEDEEDSLEYVELHLDSKNVESYTDESFTYVLDDGYQVTINKHTPETWQDKTHRHLTA